MEFIKASTRKGEQGILLELHIQPQSSKNAVIGLHGSRLKVKIDAPPVDGKANQALIAFFSDIFDLPKSRIELVHGESSRAKTLFVPGLTQEIAQNALKKWCSALK